MNVKLKEDKGFTLIEVIVAISILTIGLLAVGAMQGAALRGDSYAYSRTNASTLAQDQLEKLMSGTFISQKDETEVTPSPDPKYKVYYKITPVDGVAGASTIEVWVTYSFSNTRIPGADIKAARTSLFE